MESSVQIRRMWQGGPLRLFAATKTNNTKVGLASGGFGGSYVCDGCKRLAHGVHRVQSFGNGGANCATWLCGRCKAAASRGLRDALDKPERAPSSEGLTTRDLDGCRAHHSAPNAAGKDIEATPDGRAKRGNGAKRSERLLLVSSE